MKNYIYTVKVGDKFVPVVTPAENGVRFVNGYYISKLQKFVAEHPEIPQGGVYAEADTVAIEANLAHINEAFKTMPYHLVEDDNGVVRLVPNKVASDDEMEDDDDFDCDDCDDCDCDGCDGCDRECACDDNTSDEVQEVTITVHGDSELGRLLSDLFGNK